MKQKSGAVGATSKNHSQDADILFGPQVRYLEKWPADDANGVPSIFMEYTRLCKMDGKAVLTFCTINKLQKV